MRIRNFSAMEGVYVLTPTILADTRGRLLSAYDIDQLRESCDIKTSFVHSDIYYLIARGLAGLYYQEKNPRASLYRCLSGKAQIVAVDLRAGSLSFGKFQQVILDSEHCFGFLTKPGFATGCIGVNGPALIYVEHTTQEDIHSQKVLKWDDPQTGIMWAGLQGAPILGVKERKGVALDSIKPYEGV